ncbi:MAG: hypothetical protein WDW38_009524 [Sanguina aurantia]
MTGVPLPWHETLHAPSRAHASQRFSRWAPLADWAIPNTPRATQTAAGCGQMRRRAGPSRSRNRTCATPLEVDLAPLSRSGGGAVTCRGVGTQPATRHNPSRGFGGNRNLGPGSWNPLLLGGCQWGSGGGGSTVETLLSLLVAL